MSSEDLSTMALPTNPPPQQKQFLGHSRNGTKYRAYTEEDMNSAAQAITEDGMSLRQASIKFSVPKTTLAERMGDKRPRLPPRKHYGASGDGDGSGNSPGRKSATRYTWSDADMEKALHAISQGGVTVGEAATRFGVPPSTLNSRMRGRAPRGLRGDLSRLTLKQESLLADWARAQCELGCPPTKDEVFDLADRVLTKQGAGKRLGKQWIGHWMRRYPDLEVLEWKAKEVRLKKGDTGEEEVGGETFSGGTFEVVDG